MVANVFRVILSRNRSDPFRDFNNKSGHAVLLWRESKRDGRGIILNRRIRELDPSRFPLSRRGYNYQHRRNHEGFYPFISTGDFLRYESLEELRCLVLLEHTEDVTSIASQPFCLSFKDNSRHYPDLFAVGGDGRRTVYDVNPLDGIDDDTREVFAKTADECSRQGWRHVVLHGLAGWGWTNLEWLACFRAEDMHPKPDVEEKLLEYLQASRTLAEAATWLDPNRPVFHMPAVYHLMFRQVISFDHTAPLNLDTSIWTGGARATCHRPR